LSVVVVVVVLYIVKAKQIIMHVYRNW